MYMLYEIWIYIRYAQKTPSLLVSISIYIYIYIEPVLLPASLYGLLFRKLRMYTYIYVDIYICM